MDERCVASLCVLSSGSSGNCAVLRYHAGGRRRTVLIDAGLSPRRTRQLLGEAGLALDDVDAVVLTHLDTDHWHPGWTAGWPRCLRDDAALLVHEAHRPRAERAGTLFARPTTFGDELVLPGAAPATCCLLDHDDEGVAAFRFELPGAGSLGWVTDAGRVTDGLVSHMRAVHVLAIESNYCPRLQAGSGRPPFLIDRVTGGAGHLSNEQCLDAIERIEPAEHVVLLHLSRQCNRPDLVSDLHHGADYALTIAPRREPTRWIRVGAPEPPLVARPRVGSSARA